MTNGRRIAQTGGTVFSFLALWVVIADSAAPAELLMGGVAALAAAALGRWVAHHVAGAGFRAVWLRHLPGIAWSTVTDCWSLTVAVVHAARGHDVTGHFTEVPFELGDDDRSSARRAFVTVTTSMMPNSYVVGFDRDRGSVIVHELVGSGDAPVAADLTQAR